MVRAFSVTSSPTDPSPRVTARTNWPFSKWVAMESPSIFNSAT